MFSAETFRIASTLGTNEFKHDFAVIPILLPLSGSKAVRAAFAKMCEASLIACPLENPVIALLNVLL